jgi:putative ABC transport system permease protein
MIKNYIKIAFRNLNRHKGYSALNILGLTIGITCSLLLILYIFDELNYDTFHSKGDRIYRVWNNSTIQDTKFVAAVTPAPLGPALQAEFPEVEAFARIASGGKHLVSHNDQKFYESNFYYSDSSFFYIFGFPFLEGDPATALSEPNSIVLSKELAEKYFGNESAIGKFIKTGSEEIERKITGIMGNGPFQGHFSPRAVISYSTLPAQRLEQWSSFNEYTYVLLYPGSDPGQFEAKLPLIFDKYMAEFFRKFNAHTIFGVQPIRDIHLKSKLDGEMQKGGDISYIYIFGAVALFLLILAAINYMNLATARAARRAREVGIRKTLGSYRAQLIGQFLTESILLTFISIFFSIWLAQWLLPFFNHLTGKSISTIILLNPSIMISLLGISLLLGFVGGSYPAFYLSAFNPTEVLKGLVSRGKSGAALRRILVVFQFVISMVMVASTFIVYQQLKYATSKELGYGVENRIKIPLSGKDARAKYEVLRNELLKNPNIRNVASASTVPGHSDYSRNGTYIETAEGEMKEHIVVQSDIDYHFLETLGMQLAAGRNYSLEFPSDTINAIVVNEAMVRSMGWDEPLGKKFHIITSDELDYEVARVVGVVKDFHQFSIHQNIEPMMMTLSTNNSLMIVQIQDGRSEEALAYIRQTFRELIPERPFEYTFLTQDFEKMYEDEIRKGQVFIAFSITTILIACLGLLGLASYTAEQKRREIGIRKVNGAELHHIVALVMKDFLVLVGLAILISWPLTYALMNNWLANFAYRIGIGSSSFVLSAALGLAVTVLTVGYHSLKAAAGNPIIALKVE